MDNRRVSVRRCKHTGHVSMSVYNTVKQVVEFIPFSSNSINDGLKVEHKRDLSRTLNELSTAISNFSNIVEHYGLEDIKRAIFDSDSDLTPYQKSTIYYIVFTLYHPAPDNADNPIIRIRYE